VRLLLIRADNDPAWSNNHNVIDHDGALLKAWRLRTGVGIERSPPFTQALNDVEGSTRRFNHVFYDNLRSAYLSEWMWPPMALAATQTTQLPAVPVVLGALPARNDPR
jgi:hypothetical protein